MNTKILRETAKKIVRKTILAADESTNTIKKRMAKIGLESTPELNRKYRQLLFTSNGIENYVSGIILFDETIRQSTDDGKPFAKLLSEKDVVPGIKVDKGTVVVDPSGIDTATQGLDGLSQRLEEYAELGAGFAKWRAVFAIDDTHPTDSIIDRNAKDLAAYAMACQNADIVPIVEPEVLMNGSHSFERDAEVTNTILMAVFKKLEEYGVDWEGMILKPNMVTAGDKNANQATPSEVAEKTLEVLKKNVPSTVAGIAFLSGGQSPDLATTHLGEINKMRNQQEKEYPWRITASYGRALQGEAIEAWQGKDNNINKAQTVFLSRAEKVYKASLGQL